MGIQILPPKQNLLGSFAKGAANSLAQNVPKEIERRRLAEGLKNVSDQKGLSPFEQFTGIASTPGATPQIIESGSKLLRDQAKMDAYSRRAGKSGDAPMPERSSFDQRMEGYNQQVEQKPNVKKGMRERGVEVEPTQTGAATENPLDKKYLPPGPFTQQMRDTAIDNAFSSGLASNLGEAEAYANDAERRYKEAPEEYRKELDYRMKVDQEVDQEYDKQLATRLQKEGKETFKDLSGNEQLNIKKMARNDVATGKLTPQQAGEIYSKKSLDIAKDKSQVRNIANRDVGDRLLPGQKEDALKSLINIGKNFRDLNMQEDYADLLGSSKDQGGLGLSKGARAIIAYPRSEPVIKLIKDTKIQNKNDYITDTLKFTENLIKNMGPNDSILAIAKLMKEKHPRFNQDAYFDYLRDNQDRLGLTPRLKREVSQGKLDWSSDWADMELFPYFGKSGAYE